MVAGPFLLGWAWAMQDLHHTTGLGGLLLAFCATTTRCSVCVHSGTACRLHDKEQLAYGAACFSVRLFAELSMEAQLHSGMGQVFQAVSRQGHAVGAKFTQFTQVEPRRA